MYTTHGILFQQRSHVCPTHGGMVILLVDMEASEHTFCKRADGAVDRIREQDMVSCFGVGEKGDHAGGKPRTGYLGAGTAFYVSDHVFEYMVGLYGVGGK